MIYDIDRYIYIYMYMIYVYVFICASAYIFYVLCTFCCLLLSPLRSLILRNASRKPLWRLAAKSFGNHFVLHLAQAEKVLWGTTKSRWFEAPLTFYTHNPVSGLRDLGIQHDSTIFCTTLMKKKTFQPNKRWLCKKVITEKTRGFFPPGKPPKPPFGDSWAPLDRRRLLLGMEVSCLSNRSGGLFFHILSLLHCVEQQSQIFTLFLPFSFFFSGAIKILFNFDNLFFFACENCPSLTFHHFC